MFLYNTIIAFISQGDLSITARNCTVENEDLIPTAWAWVQLWAVWSWASFISSQQSILLSSGMVTVPHRMVVRWCKMNPVLPGKHLLLSLRARNTCTCTHVERTRTVLSASCSRYDVRFPRQVLRHSSKWWWWWWGHWERSHVWSLFPHSQVLPSMKFGSWVSASFHAPACWYLPLSPDPYE